MKASRYPVVLLAVLAGGAALDGCDHRSPAPGTEGTAKPIYYCPMHPEITRDQPGECPICNMALELMPQEKGSHVFPVKGLATVTVSQEMRQLIGVRISAVERKPVKKTIRAVGKVLYDERRISAVSLRVSGWVEELHLKAVGDPIQKGQPVLSIYSPDLLEAQKNYLRTLASQPALGHREHGNSGSLIAQSLTSARDRLLLWGITEGQIKEIEEGNEPRTRLDMLSQVDGVVIEKNVFQGAYVEAGKELFRIANLSSVWIDVEIYEREVPLVKLGDRVLVELESSPGEAIEEKVSFILPWLDRETRTARLRLEAQNPAGKLKPGMYATASIEVDLGEHLVVEEDAILDSGTRRIAFVDLGDGRLEPREVKVGERANGVVIVLDGLKVGEKVVASANFLIDSESKIKAALFQAGGGKGAPHQHGAPAPPEEKKVEGGPEASSGHPDH